jgi:hypothetical protein
MRRFSAGFWVWSVILVGAMTVLNVMSPNFRHSLYDAVMGQHVYANLLTPFVIVAGFVGGFYLRGKLEPAVLCSEVLLAYILGGVVADRNETILGGIAAATLLFVMAIALYVVYAVGSVILGWIVRFNYHGIEAMLLEDKQQQMKK